MGSRSHRLRTCFVIAGLLVFGNIAGALAADATSTPPPPTKETREKMAVLHERMAACLRSDKTIAECRRAMMHDCQTSLGEQGCPMMGWGHGMGMGPRMRSNPPPGAAPPQ